MNSAAFRQLGWLIWAVGALVVSLTTAMASQNAVPAANSSHRREIMVSIPDRKLAVLEDGQVVRIFPVAVGPSCSPSPTGDFQIVTPVSNPTYYHPGVVVPPGRNNPIGTRWIGLNANGYGIHGTNDPGSVGKAASHGCIRMRNRDIEQFFAMVRAGNVVRIRGERDAQVAQMFGAAVTNEVAEAETAISPSGGQY
jgi:L,D-transpeptidase ErfK/SrfK